MFILPLATVFFCCFLIGAIAGLWRHIPWVLSQGSNVDETECRRWQLWFSLPLIPLFPLLGLLIDRWDGREVLFAGILALAVSLAWLGQHRTLRSGLTAVLVLCLAVPCVTLPTLTVLLPATFRGLETSSALPLVGASTVGLLGTPHAQGPWLAIASFLSAGTVSLVLQLNLAFVGVCLGTLAAPQWIHAVVGRFESRRGFLLLALACLVPALFVLVTPADHFASALPNDANASQATPIFDDPLAWILAGLVFLYFPLEGLLASWRKNFWQQTDHAARLAPLVFWLVFLSARLATGWLVGDRYAIWVLVSLALGHAAMLGNLAGEFSHRGGAAWLWGAGASSAPLLPTLLAIALTLFPRTPAAVMGLMFGLGYLGNFVLQPLLQGFAANRPAPATMRLAMFLALGWAAFAFVLLLARPAEPAAHRPRPWERIKQLFPRPVGKKPRACIMPLWKQTGEHLPLSVSAVPRTLSIRSGCWASSPRTATPSFPPRMALTLSSSTPAASSSRLARSPSPSSATCSLSSSPARSAPSSWPAASPNASGTLS